MTTVFDLGYFAVGTLLFGRSLLASASMRHVPFLPEADASAESDAVAIIVTARDAGQELARCLDELSAQRGCEIEIVVVADRSRDARSIEAACADRPRVRVTHVEALEDGWLPWSNAWRRGLEATDEMCGWVVLLDQPFRFPHSQAIARGLTAARAERAAALWMVPRTRAGLLAPSVLTAITDALPAMAATNRDRESLPWPGTVCLARRDLLIEALSDPRAAMAPVFEGVVMRRARDGGARTRFAFATDEIEAPNARLGDALETVERLLATLGFRSGTMAVALLLYGALWIVAIQGAFDPNLWGRWAFGGLISLAIPCFLVARTHRLPWIAALFAPFVFPIEALATGWAVLRAVRRGGVAWRGTFIGLDRLRAAADEA